MNPVVERLIKGAVAALPAIPGGLPAEFEAALVKVIAETVIKVLERRLADPEFRAKLDAWLVEDSNEEKESHDLWVLMGS
jgi:hypothetical protein